MQADLDEGAPVTNPKIQILTGLVSDLMMVNLHFAGLLWLDTPIVKMVPGVLAEAGPCGSWETCRSIPT